MHVVESVRYILTHLFQNLRMTLGTGHLLQVGGGGSTKRAGGGSFGVVFTQ